MKKVFSLALMALTVVFSACAQDRVVTFEQLPANAQKVILKSGNWMMVIGRLN